MLAQVAAASSAHGAAHVHLGAGFGEGEVAGSHPDPDLGPEEALGEVVQGALEVREAHVLVHVKGFHLVEHAVGAGADGLVAVDPTRGDGADRWPLAFHHAHLHAAGVGAQGHTIRATGAVRALHEEGVLHVSRRVVGGKVERAEVVAVVLHLRPLADREAHAGEDVHDTLANDGDGVQASGVSGSGRSAQVHHRTCGGLFLAQGTLELIQPLLGLLLEHVHALAQGTFLFSGHLLEVLEQSSDTSVAAEHGYTELLHLLGGPRSGGVQLGLQGSDPVQQAHGSTRMNIRRSFSGRSRASQGWLARASSTSSPSTTSPNTV